MLSFQDQLAAAARTNAEAQIAMMMTLADQTFKSVEQMIDLNVNVAKSSLDDSTSAFQQMMSAKDPQEFLSVSAAQAQPVAEKALAYGRNLASIAARTQIELAKAAESQIADTSRRVISLIEEAGKNGPAGSESAMALVRSAIDTASASCEQMLKTTKQAVEMLELNINSTAQFTPAGGKPRSSSSKK